MNVALEIIVSGICFTGARVIREYHHKVLVLLLAMVTK
jgi:hypothetical protein